MKKKIFVTICLLFIITVTAYAKTSKMDVDTKNIELQLNGKTNAITSNFNKNYAIDYNSNDLYVDKKFQKQMTDLTNRTTYLLLGAPNTKNDNYVEYAKRKKELFLLRYAPLIPKTADGKLDSTSVEYKDDTATGMNIPGMLKLLSEKNINYSGHGNVKIFQTKDYTITKTALSGVTIEWPNEDNPKKIDLLKTNMILTYFYKLYNNEYKLYWIMAETNDDVESFFQGLGENEEENKSGALNSKYISELSSFYDYSKLKNIKDIDINNIYNANIGNIVLLNTYYDKSIVNTGVGFFIEDGIIATTWEFVEKSLMKGQFLIISDSSGKVYEYDGFVTATPELDIAIIKLKVKTNNKVTLDSVDNMQENDPVISISTKSGYGLSVVSGIMISKGSEIKSLIPLSSTDSGSPLFNSYGKVIGINTSKSLNSSISIAMSSKYLIELKQKLSSIDFDKINYLSFDKLKEKYYFHNFNEELVVNSLDKKIWDEYSKIGKIKTSLILKLKKASYYDGVVSLRYQNDATDFISNIKMASSFIGKLKDEGYKSTYDSNDKKIYDNGKYKVIVMNEFNSLIILLVRK